MRQVIQLHSKYKNLNPGEWAGFEDPSEIEYILTGKAVSDIGGKKVVGKIGSAGVLVKATKAFSLDEVGDILRAKPAHLKAQHEEGDHFPLLLEHAEKLQKAGFVEPLVAIRYRKDVKLDGGAVIEKDTEKNVTAVEASTLEKTGVAKRLEKQKAKFAD